MVLQGHVAVEEKFVVCRILSAGMGVARGGGHGGHAPPQSILDKSKDLGNYDKHLPLRGCFLAGLLISGLTKEKYNTTLLFCVGQSCDGAAAMASEGSGVTSIVQNESPLAFYFYCATQCLNLSAFAAVKVSAIQNAKNVARKVVKCLRPMRRKQRC